MGSPAGFEGVARAEAQGKRPETVRVWLLGGFRVCVGSRTIEGDTWRLRKAAAMVKLLALAPDHRLHREQVMDLLWPDLGKRAASNNLRQVLYGARRILDPDSDNRNRYLSFQDGKLALCPGGDLWVDVRAFEEVASSARRSRDLSAYRAALELYAGDLLPEDRYEEWTQSRREELRQSYIALLIELAGLSEELNENNVAIEALRKVTATEPTLEEAHAALMRLQALSGQPERALIQYERLRDVLSRELGTDPSPPTRRLRDEIATGGLTPTLPASPPQEEELLAVGKHNLPTRRTSFVGRERELVEVKRDLSMTRLLTLTGAGGSGKTRLALEAARDLVGIYPHGVWFVDLAPLMEEDLVPQEVAGTLEVPEVPGQPLADTLADALGEKELLLIVDNCEHLVEAAAKLVDALLVACPRFRVLATSREPLGVEGEIQRAVPPLSLPGPTEVGSDDDSTVESIMRYEAVRLYLDRARLRQPDFRLTRENAGAVAGVCRKLDGIPLAIELATARMGALGVEQVAQRLEASLDVLKGISRTAELRHQTMKATLDWSHDLLSQLERAMLRRLSAFAGTWTSEAAEAVCSGGIEQDEVLDLLGRLVDKSLVVAAASTGGTVRYRMLEPIRQYARGKLEESGEAEVVQDRHATFFLTLAEEAEPELAGPQQGLWVARLEAENDNLREALSWVLEAGEAEQGLRFGAALWRFWYYRSYLSEGVRWLDEALAGCDLVASPVRVKALEGMGWLAHSPAGSQTVRSLPGFRSPSEPQETTSPGSSRSWGSTRGPRSLAG